MNDLEIILSDLQSLTLLFKELKAVENINIPEECFQKIVEEKCNEIKNLTSNIFKEKRRSK